MLRGVCLIRCLSRDGRIILLPSASMTSARETVVESAPSTSSKKGSPSAGSNDDIFSRHGGKMLIVFLAGVSGLVGRSFLGTSKSNALREEIEDERVLEPYELEDLRCENNFDPSVFLGIRHRVETEFPDGKAEYPSFVGFVAPLLPKPLVLGHYLDRSVLNLRAQADAQGLYSTDLLLVGLCNAINTTIPERLHHLWLLTKRMSTESGGSNDTALEDDQPPTEADVVSADSVSRLLDLMLQTSQIPSSRMVVKSDVKWPVQQYEHATGVRLLRDALAEIHLDQARKQSGWIERKLAPKFDPSHCKNVSWSSFEQIIAKSGAICAWGECYSSSRSNT